MMAAWLAWEDTAAPILRRLRRAEREPTRAELDVLEKRPERDPSVVFAIDAYHDVSTCRPVGFGVAPIPTTAIRGWCRQHGLDHDATEFLTGAIRYVDGRVREKYAEKG
jgi:hypothetical protein